MGCFAGIYSMWMMRPTCVFSLQDTSRYNPRLSYVGSHGNEEAKAVSPFSFELFFQVEMIAHVGVIDDHSHELACCELQSKLGETLVMCCSSEKGETEREREERERHIGKRHLGYKD